jgi:hypothetical protein
MQRKLIIIAIVIAAIGLVVSVVLLRKPATKSPVTKTPIKKNAPIIQTGTIPSLSVDSPQPVGDTITVAKVTLPIHGFVIIRDALSNKIVGSSNVIIFPETINMKVAATVVAGKTYIAEINADGDNNGLFDPQHDPPFIVSGKTITAFFKVK